MSDNIIKTRIKLKRDNDYNYNLVKDSFIPLNGEPILVDTAGDGLRVKIGDGSKTYDQLDFQDSLFVYGYYKDGDFYEDSQHTNLITGVINRLYINNDDYKVYFYNGENFFIVNGCSLATDVTPGVVILYNTTGQHTDGTMTQKAITDELNTKFTVDINSDSETIIFSTN